MVGLDREARGGTVRDIDYWLAPVECRISATRLFVLLCVLPLLAAATSAKYGDGIEYGAELGVLRCSKVVLTPVIRHTATVNGMPTWKISPLRSTRTVTCDEVAVPIGDGRMFLPVAVPAGHTAQVWVTSETLGLPNQPPFMLWNPPPEYVPSAPLEISLRGK